MSQNYPSELIPLKKLLRSSRSRLEVAKAKIGALRFGEECLVEFNGFNLREQLRIVRETYPFSIFDFTIKYHSQYAPVFRVKWIATTGQTRKVAA